MQDDALRSVLAPFNPWWHGGAFSHVPTWRRQAWGELHRWATRPPAHRALLVSGARQVGKSTLLLQLAQSLLADGLPPANLLYASFDHPLLKRCGLEAVLAAWREGESRQAGPEYLLLDEAQHLPDLGTWVKHQVDFDKGRRIVFTGSATPLLEAGQESGLGRWHTLHLGTMSFYESVHIQGLLRPNLPSLTHLEALAEWGPAQFQQVSHLAQPLVGHFHEHLLRGGFPQTAGVHDLGLAQSMLREDILDRALRRDMGALFGLRHILDLEQTFLYLCLHDGGLLNVSDLASHLEVNRATAQRFLELLEACHLTHRLPPFGQGKSVLKGRFKVYLADPAMGPSVMMRGKSLLNDATALGASVESAVVKHLLGAHRGQGLRFSHWRNQGDQEVDVVAEWGSTALPMEVKYRAQRPDPRDLKGLRAFCEAQAPPQAFVVTKALNHFGPLASDAFHGTPVVQVPAPLLCWWLGEAEGRGLLGPRDAFGE